MCVFIHTCTLDGGWVDADGLYFLESALIALIGRQSLVQSLLGDRRWFTVLALDSLEQLETEEEMGIDEHFLKLLATEPKRMM